MLLALTFSGVLFGQPYTIQTFAGQPNYSIPFPWNVQGTAAALSTLPAVAADGKGGVYVLQPDYYAVVHMDATGYLTLVAGTGNGKSGFSGDGIPAAGAALGTPTAIAVDMAGNVYITDIDFPRVRKISAGIITTVAGDGTGGNLLDNGPATAAHLSRDMSSLAVDSAGNIYIGEPGRTAIFNFDTKGSSGRIRKVSNGIITTVAGGVDGGLGESGPASNAAVFPAGIAVDSAGSLYISDSCFRRIRKVTDGIITTIAGTGDGDGVLKCGETSFTGDGPALSTGLFALGPLTVDAAGSVFFTYRTFGFYDSLGYYGPPGYSGPTGGRVLKLSDGMITTVAGGGVDLPDGSSRADNIPAAGAYLVYPGGVAVDSAGNVYVTDVYESAFQHSLKIARLRMVTGGLITTVAGAQIDTSTGDGGPATGALLSLPWTVALDGAGSVYIAETNTPRIRKVTNGVITTVAGDGNQGFLGENAAAILARLSAPYGIAVDAAGNLYISDANNQRVRKVSGGVITTIAGNGTFGFSGDNGPAVKAQLGSPLGLAVGPDGGLYIAGNGCVRKLLGGVITTVAGGGSVIGDGVPATEAKLDPRDVAVDAAGILYIADPLNARGWRVADGIITTVAGNGSQTWSGDNGPATGAGVSPDSLALDGDGNLFMTDRTNRIRKLTNGVITTVAGTGTAGFSGDGGLATDATLNSPTGIRVDASGRIYVADYWNNRIRVLTPGAPPPPPQCDPHLGIPGLESPFAGTSYTLKIAPTQFPCAWSVSGLPDWITLRGPASGTGSATFTLVVAPNSIVPRRADILVSGTKIFITQKGPPCPTLLSGGARAFTAVAASGSITVTASPTCSWNVASSQSWISLTDTPLGTGNGVVRYQVLANSGTAERNGGLYLNGTDNSLIYLIEQQPATLPGLNLAGSIPHTATAENWTTTFTLYNRGDATAQARLSLFDNNGNALPVWFNLPKQQFPSGLLLAPSLDRSLVPNTILVMEGGGPSDGPVQIGSAQLAATGSVDGFAIFHLIPGAQEAVVPLETRNASSYLLAFDNTFDVATGVALENVSSQAANVSVVIRDDHGVPLGTAGAVIPLAANGHVSFGLSDQYPATTNQRGTIEFDTPAGGRISVVGIRTTPLDSSKTLTTIPVLANVGANGGSIAHIATGNGWQTTFVLVNSGAAAAQAHLKFFADNGSPLALPLSYPQSGAGTASTSPAVDQTLAAGATLVLQSLASPLDPAPTVGSAQLTANGNVGGFVIFRYNPNGQEAAIPLENRNAGALVLAFDNTNGTTTGIAINSVSAQAVSVPVVVRNDAGDQIATDSISLAANGHLAFTLATDKYPSAANIRGTIEFTAPAGAQIGALGIRIPTAHTFTSLPALAK